MWRKEDSAVTCLLALLALRIFLGKGLTFFARLPRRMLKAAVEL